MTHLKEGDSAPPFEGTDQHENTIKLSDFRGKKLILYFYPKDNTPGCTAEACDLRDHYQVFLEKGYAITGISPDSLNSHKRFSGKFNLPFPLIADPEKKILSNYGVWGEKKNYGRTYMGVYRTTFIIDEEGKIMKIFTKVKTKEHTKQILDAMEE